MNYVTNIEKPRIEDCDFYNTTTFPSGIRVDGQWDVEDKIKQYTGNIDWSGKRVLDVGAASGMVSFHVESSGSDVVSMDVADGETWEQLPYYGVCYDMNAWCGGVRRLKNAYWFAHHEMKARCRAVYCNIYDIPKEVGEFTHALFGAVLLHLSNPFGAIRAVAKHVTDTIVVTDMYRPQTPGMIFAPALEDSQNACAWWYVAYEQVERMLNVLGFKKVSFDVFYIRSVPHNQLSPFYCMVASR